MSATCLICGLRIQRGDDRGRLRLTSGGTVEDWHHLATVAGQSAEDDHQPQLDTIHTGEESHDRLDSTTRLGRAMVDDTRRHR